MSVSSYGIWISYISFCFFFFFQAEDGIRDVAVTGVQTCALPICCSWEAATDRIVVLEDPVRRAFSTVNCVQVRTEKIWVVIKNVVQVVISGDIKRNAVLIVVKGKRRTRRIVTCLSLEPPVAAKINVNGVAGVQLEEARNSPAAERMTYDPLLLLQEGHLIDYIEFVSVFVVKGSFAIRKFGKRI